MQTTINLRVYKKLTQKLRRNQNITNNNKIVNRLKEQILKLLLN